MFTLIIKIIQILKLKILCIVCGLIVSLFLFNLTFLDILNLYQTFALIFIIIDLVLLLVFWWILRYASNMFMLPFFIVKLFDFKSESP